MLVDRRGGTARIGGKDLGGAARRGQQDAGDLIFPQGGDNGGQGRRLARSGITVDDEDIPVIGGHEISHVPQQAVLARGRRISHPRHETLMEKGGPAHLREREKMMEKTARTG